MQGRDEGHEGGAVVVVEDEERASSTPRMIGPASRPVLEALGPLRDGIS